MNDREPCKHAMAAAKEILLIPPGFADTEGCAQIIEERMGTIYVEAALRYCMKNGDARIRVVALEALKKMGVEP